MDGQARLPTDHLVSKPMTTTWSRSPAGSSTVLDGRIVVSKATVVAAQDRWGVQRLQQAHSPSAVSEGSVWAVGGTDEELRRVDGRQTGTRAPGPTNWTVLNTDSVSHLPDAANRRLPPAAGKPAGQRPRRALTCF